MKYIKRIILLIIIHLFISGCAKPSLPQIGKFIMAHGAPHIVQDGVCYYVGAWGPGTTVLKIYYDNSDTHKNTEHLGFRYVEGGPVYPSKQQVTAIEGEYIDEEDLHFYIPLLIDSLKDTAPGCKGERALKKLYAIMHQTYPNGYGDYYMHSTQNPYTGTPFMAKYQDIEIDETTYTQWIEWWQTEGYNDFPKSR